MTSQPISWRELLQALVEALQSMPTNDMKTKVLIADQIKALKEKIAQLKEQQEQTQTVTSTKEAQGGSNQKR